MAIKVRAGKTKMMSFPKTASTAFTDGAFVTLSSGYLIPATSSTTKLLGVIRKTVASTDSDYASTTMVPVQVPIEDYVEWEADTASAVAADVGNAVDLTDSLTVNRGGTTHHVVTITQLISASKVLVVINGTYNNYNGG